MDWYDENDIARRIHLADRHSRELSLPDNLAIRPCVAELIDTGAEKGARSDTAFAIASELARLGIDDTSRVTRFLGDWNAKLSLPLTFPEVRANARSAIQKGYSFGCTHALLRQHCVGKGDCPHVRQYNKKGGKFQLLQFTKSGWQRVLNRGAILLYVVGLTELERVRMVPAGGKVVASVRQIAHASGLSRRRLNEPLGTLQAHGLIEWTKGIPRKWEGRATEITRVVPMPPCPKRR